ncbi:MAG: START domain-containing protein 10 [Paramarteilia canceri]
MDVDDLDANDMYDMLHDPQYRKKWDDNMIKGFNMIKFTDFSDVGFYLVKVPIPFFSDRYSVAQRSWHKFSDDEFIIFNHSVSERPNYKKYLQLYSLNMKQSSVLMTSYVSGYYMKNENGKCKFIYITCSDLGFFLPQTIINKIKKSTIPKVVDKLIENAKVYREWRDSNSVDLQDNTFQSVPGDEEKCKQNKHPWRGQNYAASDSSDEHKQNCEKCIELLANSEK